MNYYKLYIKNEKGSYESKTNPEIYKTKEEVINRVRGLNKDTILIYRCNGTDNIENKKEYEDYER